MVDVLLVHPDAEVRAAMRALLRTRFPDLTIRDANGSPREAQEAAVVVNADDLLRPIAARLTSASPHLASLTERQREIAHMVAVGARNKQVAYALGIRGSTVKNHLSVIFRLLRVADRAELMSLAHREGWPLRTTP